MRGLRQRLFRDLGLDRLAEELREPVTTETEAYFAGLIGAILPLLGAIGLVMTLVMWALDPYVLSNDVDALGYYTQFRWLSLATSGVVLLGTPWLRRWPVGFSVGVFGAFSVAAGHVLGGAGGIDEPIFWAWPFVVYLLLVLPLRLRWRAVAHAGVLGGFAVAYLARQPDPVAHPHFAMGVTVYAAATAMSLPLGALLSALLRRSHRQARELEAERAKSEKLVASMLPSSIAERLKERPGAIAERHDDAIVLFADVAGFTRLSEATSPEKLVEFLNEVFVTFDALAEEHGLDKIKTIGDAYMAVGGFEGDVDEALVGAIELGLSMIERGGALIGPDGEPLRLRIGIHRGPVVAGVIGTSRYAYDVWGDTVNTASRMESHGKVGRVMISDTARRSLDERFELEERSALPVKGKGEMRCWLVVGRRHRAAS